MAVVWCLPFSCFVFLSMYEFIGMRPCGVSSPAPARAAEFAGALF